MPMVHPNGGRRNIFPTRNTFQEAYDFVGSDGVTFESMTGKQINARQDTTKDGAHITIFHGLMTSLAIVLVISSSNTTGYVSLMRLANSLSAQGQPSPDAA